MQCSGFHLEGNAEVLQEGDERRRCRPLAESHDGIKGPAPLHVVLDETQGGIHPLEGPLLLTAGAANFLLFVHRHYGILRRGHCVRGLPHPWYTLNSLTPTWAFHHS